MTSVKHFGVEVKSNSFESKNNNILCQKKFTESNKEKTTKTELLLLIDKFNKKVIKNNNSERKIQNNFKSSFPPAGFCSQAPMPSESAVNRYVQNRRLRLNSAENAPAGDSASVGSVDDELPGAKRTRWAGDN
jgi:hypothetical protein